MRMNTTTVKRYLAAPSFPERTPYPRLPSKLDPYLPYLERRWVEGETSGPVLLAELQAQGFVGSLMTVNRWAMRHQQVIPPAASRRSKLCKLQPGDIPPPAPAESAHGLVGAGGTGELVGGSTSRAGADGSGRAFIKSIFTLTYASEHESFYAESRVITTACLSGSTSIDSPAIVARICLTSCSSDVP